MKQSLFIENKISVYHQTLCNTVYVFCSAHGWLCNYNPLFWSTAHNIHSHHGKQHLQHYLFTMLLVTIFNKFSCRESKHIMSVVWRKLVALQDCWISSWQILIFRMLKHKCMSADLPGKYFWKNLWNTKLNKNNYCNNTENILPSYLSNKTKRQS